nr:hypothetical protein [Tanacetum cinerariifolium]
KRTYKLCKCGFDLRMVERSWSLWRYCNSSLIGLCNVRGGSGGTEGKVGTGGLWGSCGRWNESMIESVVISKDR